MNVSLSGVAATNGSLANGDSMEPVHSAGVLNNTGLASGAPEACKKKRKNGKRRLPKSKTLLNNAVFTTNVPSSTNTSPDFTCAKVFPPLRPSR